MEDNEIIEKLGIDKNDLNELKTHFEFKGWLGTGAYGIVVKATYHKIDELVAVKVILIP